MPIPYSFIAEHIRNAIVQKLDAHDYGQFMESSRLSYDTAIKIRTKLVASTENVVYVTINNGDLMYRIKFFGWFQPIEWIVRSELLESTPLRIVAKEVIVEVSATKEICEKLIESLRRTLSSFECLRMRGIICTPETFNTLLTSSNCQKFVCRASIPKEFVKVPAMQKLNHLDIVCHMDDDDLLSLKMPRMRLYGTNITSSGVNLFLKEYFDKKRDCVNVYIDLNLNGIDKEIMRAGLDLIHPETSDSDNEGPITTRRVKIKYYFIRSSVRLLPIGCKD